ncbi:SOS response-associated peptidase family protein [Amphritea sp. HPY]|uniref:SOS response-associated peptidase family protein n=1 Tax=Amphritea sp. HPY TaxID=3421652 RepID=UPI003D7E3C9B
MCGFFEFNNSSSQADELIEALGIEDQAPMFRKNLGSGPASSVDIVVQSGNERIVVPAVWWLLLDQQTLKPSRYTSFNTRSDKLNVKNSAGYHPYRQHRCIIPATAVVEGEGPKGSRKYHRIEPQHCAFALGGLYRQWINKDSGEHATSCSVITLSPHPAWEKIHSKSTPLFLPHDDKALIDAWLDPAFTQVDKFDQLLTPTFRDSMLITPIDRPSTRQPVGDSFIL